MIELLWQAFHAEKGLLVRTDNVKRLREKLYLIRKTDSDLMSLSFIVSPTNPTTELWIVKVRKANAETE